MKKTFLLIVAFQIFACYQTALFAQTKNLPNSKPAGIDYSKYIGKTVKQFLEDFHLPILDTFAIREAYYVSGFIVKLENNKSLEIYPKLKYDSSQFKKMHDKFNIQLFYTNKIKCIRYNVNGKTIKQYGRYTR